MPASSKREQHDKLRRYLIEHGCPFDSLPPEAVTLPVLICQSGPAVMFRIGAGLTSMTGLCLPVELATKASRGVRIEQVEVECDVSHLDFELLGPPKKVGLQYRFVGGFAMEWQDALNHRVPGVVYPNHPWVGCLLLWSMQSLPASCKRPILSMTIWDHFGKVGFEALDVMIDSTTHCEPAREDAPLSPLFAEIPEPPPREEWWEYDQLLKQKPPATESPSVVDVFGLDVEPFEPGELKEDSYVLAEASCSARRSSGRAPQFLCALRPIPGCAGIQSSRVNGSSRPAILQALA